MSFEAGWYSSLAYFVYFACAWPWTFFCNFMIHKILVVLCACYYYMQKKMFLNWLAGIIFLGYVRGGNRIASVCSHFFPWKKDWLLLPGVVRLNAHAHVAQLELLLPTVFGGGPYLVLFTVSSPLSTPGLSWVPSPRSWPHAFSPEPLSVAVTVSLFPFLGQRSRDVWKYEGAICRCFWIHELRFETEPSLPVLCS